MNKDWITILICGFMAGTMFQLSVEHLRLEQYWKIIIDWALAACNIAGAAYLVKKRNQCVQ